MSKKILSDKTLVSRCQKNDDAEAFGELYSRYFGKTKLYLISRTGVGEHDANDIVQKAFIKAMHKIKAFRGICEFGTWVYRIAHNTFLDQIRSNRNTVSLEDTLRVSPQTRENHLVSFINDYSDIPETTEYDDPSTLMSDREDFSNITDKINRAKKGLTPNQRLIFELIFIKNMSYQEVSKKVNCPIGTVMSRVHFARKKLQDILNKELAYDASK